MKYADGTAIRWINRAACGARLVGDKGEIVFHSYNGRNEIAPEALRSEIITPHVIHLYNSNNHAANFIECVRSRRDPVSDVEVGHRTATALHIAEIGLRLNRPLKWDPEKESFLGDDEANRWRQGPSRAPWTV